MTSQAKCAIHFSTAFGTLPAVTSEGGSGGSSEGTAKTISKHFPLTVPCRATATQVMESVETDFTRFGNYSRWGGLESVTFSPPKGMAVGSKIPIKVSVFGIPQNLSVTVESMNAQSMTFTTNPGHLLYPAHITFAASSASQGSINFNIDLGGAVAEPIRSYMSGNSFEDAQWHHFLAQIGSLCKTGVE